MELIIGIGVGVIAMIALFALKCRRPPQRDDWRAGRRRGLGQADDGVGWQEPPSFEEYANGGRGYGDASRQWPGR